MGELRLRSIERGSHNLNCFYGRKVAVAPESISEDMIAAKNLEIEAMLSGDLTKPSILSKGPRTVAAEA